MTIRNDSGDGHDGAIPRLLGEPRISEADSSLSEQFVSTYFVLVAGMSSSPVNGK